MRNLFRNWTSRFTSEPNDSPPQDIGSMGREQRAQLVDDLRAKISHIQHEITDLNESMTADAAQGTPAQQSQMKQLHNDLSVTQRELSRYQARI